MQNATPRPKTYSEILTAAQAANIVDWNRDSKSLRVYIDNIPLDLRVVLSLRIESGKCGILDTAELSGYNKERNAWTGETRTKSTPLPNRKGLKSLLDWIKAKAIEQTNISNPASLSIYRK